MDTTLSKSVCLVATIAFLSISGYSATYTIDSTNTSTADDKVTINGAIFQKNVTGSGSGTFTRLFKLPISGNGTTTEGYNYDYTAAGASSAPFDQDGANGFDPHLDLGTIPVWTDPSTGLQYLQLLYDSAGTRQLVEFRMYVASDPNNTNANTYVNTEANLSNLGTLVYDMDAGGDNTLNMIIPSGSGVSDISFNIPITALPSNAGGNDNVFIWMKFTNTNGTFHELAYDKQNLNPSFGSLVPEPATFGGGLVLLGLAGGARIRRRSNCKSATAPTIR